MSRCFTVWLAAIAAIGGCRAAEHPPLMLGDSPSIPYTELNRRPVIGQLGKPLGVPFEIEAIVVSSASEGWKGGGEYFLDVMKVDGQPIAAPVKMRFEDFTFGYTDLAADVSVLDKRAHGTLSENMNTDMIAELEKGYVGKRFRLSVWESGSFSGMPSHMPRDATSWQDHGFCFQTQLNIAVDYTYRKEHPNRAGYRN